MGWDGERAWGRTKEQYMQDDIGRYYNIIESNWKGNEWYAALSNKEKPDKIFGIVCLIRKDGEYFMVKRMDETQGPYYYGASKKVIQALTPLNILYTEGNENAQTWREKCMNKPAPEKKAIINVGDTIEYGEGLRLIGGYVCTRFEKIEDKIFRSSVGPLVKIVRPEKHGKFIVIPKEQPMFRENGATNKAEQSTGTTNKAEQLTIF